MFAFRKTLTLCFLAGYVCFVGTLAVSTSTAQCVEAPSGMIAWWAGDIDGTDITGNGYDAILDEGVGAGVPGKVEGAFEFDGVDDIAYTDLLLSPQGTIDFWIWIAPGELSAGHRVVGTYGTANGGDRLWIGVNGPLGGSGVPPNTLAVNLGSSSVNDIVVPNPIPEGTWAHLALTFDYSADIYTLYVNGEETASPPSAVDRNPPTRPLSFGGVEADFQPKVSYFPGLIDELEIFDRVLTEDEIETIFLADTAGKCAPILTIAEAQIGFDNSTENADTFKVVGELALDPFSDGIYPTSEEVKVTVGPWQIILPAGSVEEGKHGRMEFKGVIDGVDVLFRIEPLAVDTFEFLAQARGVDLTDTTNLVTVQLLIGNDFGMNRARLAGTLRLFQKAKGREN